WLDELRAGDHVLWSFERDACAPLVRVPDDQVLPSDSRHRPDLRALATYDLDEAQDRKFQVEKLQRSDRAFRKDGRRPTHWTFAASTKAKMTTTSPEGATSAPVADSAVASLTHLCLEAVARHIFQFYNSRLLDRCLGDSTCQSLLHAFDVSIVERLRDDGKLTAVILSHLPTKPSKSSLGLERRFGELLFLEKHALNARDIVRNYTFPLHDCVYMSRLSTIDFVTPRYGRIALDWRPRKLYTAVLCPHLQTFPKAQNLYAIDLLQRFDTIERLCLVSCCLGTAGVIVLASAIDVRAPCSSDALTHFVSQHVKALRVLDLSNDMWAAHKSAYSNRIGDAGAMALASALRTNASVIKDKRETGGHGADPRVRRFNEVGTIWRNTVIGFTFGSSLRDLDLEWCHLPPGMGTHLSQVRRHRQDDNLS
ncbi:hypothetical protein DYB28_007168, partial [Aphanomyces astaci]